MRNFKLALQKDKRGFLLTCIFSYLALLYHLGFLFLFKKIRVYPMYIFNFFSVTIFLSLSIILQKNKHYDRIYTISLAEVAIHQILSDYYIGIECHFHYLLLPVALLSLITKKEKVISGMIYSGLSALIIIVFEMLSKIYKPVYIISYKYLTFIKFTNTFLGIFLVIFAVFIFTYIVNSMEDSLETQVLQKTADLKEKTEKVIQLQNQTIFSLANLVENRDADTGGHIRRTSAYVGILARKMAENGIYAKILSDEYIDILERAAPLHDIGKITISDTILKKPGKLTTEEFEMMKNHTTEGEKIVKEIIGFSEDKEYLKAACEISLNHHEKWNGNGYPRGLKGIEIPICARIMALADVFDALVEKRCYKEPMTMDTAFKIIQEEAGKQFDPELTKLFIELRPQIEQIHEKYNDVGNTKLKQ